MKNTNLCDDKNTKTIVVDKKKVPLTKKTFELYITGKHSLREICKIINDLGLISRKQKQLSISNYQYLLKNPFYCGLIRYNNELYEGKHEPIIAKKLFNKTQEIMNGKSRPNKKETEVFCFSRFYPLCRMRLSDYRRNPKGP